MTGEIKHLPEDEVPVLRKATCHAAAAEIIALLQIRGLIIVDSLTDAGLKIKGFDGDRVGDRVAGLLGHKTKHRRRNIIRLHCELQVTFDPVEAVKFGLRLGNQSQCRPCRKVGIVVGTGIGAVRNFVGQGIVNRIEFDNKDRDGNPFRGLA